MQENTLSSATNSNELLANSPSASAALGTSSSSSFASASSSVSAVSFLHFLAQSPPKDDNANSLTTASTSPTNADLSPKVFDKDVTHYEFEFATLYQHPETKKLFTAHATKGTQQEHTLFATANLWNRTFPCIKTLLTDRTQCWKRWICWRCRQLLLQTFITRRTSHVRQVY